jgi:hypothetical protein
VAPDMEWVVMAFSEGGNALPRATSPDADCAAPRNYRSVGIKCLEMIPIALTDTAYDAIASSCPKAQHDGPCSAIGAGASSTSRRRWSTA